MAYTRVWSNITPPGSQAANTADDEIRNVRLDIYERMADAGIDFDTDPITNTIGNATGKQARFHWSAGHWQGSSSLAPIFNVLSDGSGKAISPVDVSTALDGLINIPLLPGSIITAVHCLLYRASAGSTVSRFTLKKVDTVSGSPVASAIGAVSNATANDTWQSISLASGLPYTVVNTETYHVHVELTNNSSINTAARFSDVIIVYTTPSVMALL